MKKNLLLTGLFLLTITSFFLLTTDGWVYLSVALMAAIPLAALRLFRKRFMKITRWAKTHQWSAIGLITLLQVIILILGLVTGYNLQKAGFEISGISIFVFSAIMVLGFFTVHFLPKQQTIAIPSRVNRDRLAYLSIMVSSFVLTVATGNRIEERFPHSALTYALQSIDKTVFPAVEVSAEDLETPVLRQDNSREPVVSGFSTMFITASLVVNENETIQPSGDAKKELKEKKKLEKRALKFEKKKAKIVKRINKWRKAMAAGSGVGTALMFILLLLALCSGICLMVGGFGGGSPWIGVLGILITAAVIWGFVELFKKSPTKNKPD